ncbi:hypothetical protein DOTSEDRAFT_54187 [Dothistroma septosporum NZE10]|uniref:UDP-glucose 6-dehydrogenase n=1 Tax=Dothistroma septosporum (strain NZE10 / CBS 128990) TaxID=675120 RepID=M2WMU1_DOTSN|nr:hypothetical protein DOTSEDRAFT_54187 [Dothistroma septosporum NZE10]
MSEMVLSHRPATPTQPALHAVFPDILNPDTASNVPIRSVCCIGAGYVGGPTAAVIALYNPHVRVTVVDRDELRINAWKGRHLPIHEPGLVDVVRLARDGSTSSRHVSGARQPNLFFPTSCTQIIAEADMVLISVNTNTKKRGVGAGRATDMTALEGAARDVAIHAKAGTIIAEKSTVPVKTVQLIKDIMEAHRPGLVFPQHQYISAICEKTGADVGEIAKSVGLDPRIGPQFLKAGLAFGGSCFRKDIASLTYLADHWDCLKLRFNGSSEGDIRRELSILEGEYPVAKPNGPIEVVLDSYAACADSSAVLVLTDWDMFKDTMISSSKPIVHDTCGAPPGAIPLSDHAVKPAMPAKTSSLPATMAEQLIPELACPSECGECANALATGQFADKNITTPLSWSAISQSVREPRWVFDGRGLLDFHPMTSLGSRLETLGQASIY